MKKTSQNKKTHRIDIKAIFADSVLRKDLMVSLIQAIQAHEGIKTTKKQAEKAYDKILAEKIR